MAPSILIDSASPEMKYAGEQWKLGFDPDVHGGSTNTCRTNLTVSTTTSIPPTLLVSFHGTGIRFYGQPSNGFALNYTFDNSRSRVADTNTTQEISGKTGIQLWGVEQVTSGLHSISLIPTGGQPSFDYAVVTPTSSSPLNEKILVLDDTDLQIKYNGVWVPETGKRFPNGIAFGDTMRGTTRKGDSMTLGFVGSSISVYGLLNQRPGILSSTYSIDGGPPTTFTAYNGSQTAASDIWSLSQRFFFKEVIPGNHTLTVTVSEITGSQVFYIDYITFEGTSATSLTPKSTTQSGSKSSHEKLIGGIVAGGIVLLILLSCLRAKFQRMVKSWRSQNPSDHGTYVPPPVYEPPLHPPPLHAPPHFASPSWGYGAGPAPSDPAIPHLQREIDILRLQNEQIQREVEERRRREAEERLQREGAERIRREADERARREVAERSQRDAEERTRREASERTVRETAERPSPRPAATNDTDAGPAEPPPPYDASHYIP
ncbi:hypothetical protein BDZ94DRAFT_1315683 [Collybia nuda]|uniref:Uncharacterized protein n=1 Tax=Collybia nuda TaxID=64659 RepID=A0A9P5XUF5_9AGAR|nr:hypothetical protein BDZ94DRAFT_1315683 [Collybia nuda]